MFRLKDFDYKSPFFYMATLKRIKGLEPFSQIGPHGLVESDITRAFVDVLRSFHAKWQCIEEISPFIVMPDHIHMIVKIKDVAKRKSLPVIVWQVTRELSKEYWRVVKGRSPSKQNPNRTYPQDSFAEGGDTRLQNIFAPDWHDWIVKKTGQLAAFRRYIRENPARAWARKANAQFFRRVEAVEFLGRRWFAYGNPDILNLPALTPFKGHRATPEGSDKWNAAVTAASRIGPGGAGISTFMSPLEKAGGNAIAKAGGRLIVLSPEGFGPHWHPPRDKERFCAAGRMLFLSLYEAEARQPTRKELYERCHEMIDHAMSSLPGIEA